MIKRLIFDVDNTLIMWSDKFLQSLEDTVKEYKLEIDYLNIDASIESYENSHDHYNKQLLIEHINKENNLNLGIDFLDSWLKRFNNNYYVDEDVIDTLNYLSKKYELIILTNWFLESQKARLKGSKILKYFTEFYSGEKYLKPNPTIFKLACGNRVASECVMIGDDFIRDIKGANNIGMDAIMITNKDIEESSKYKIIKNIKELKEIL